MGHDSGVWQPLLPGKTCPAICSGRRMPYSHSPDDSGSFPAPEPMRALEVALEGKKMMKCHSSWEEGGGKYRTI